MIKLFALTLLLITALWAPITPQPVTVHFQPNTPVVTGLAIVNDYAGDQFTTTWLDTTGQRWYSAIQWPNRHIQGGQHKNESLTAAYLYNLTPAQITTLQANPLVATVQTYPPYLANAAFFFQQIQQLIHSIASHR